MSKRTSLAALRCAVFLLIIGFMFAEPASENATANGGPTRLLRTPTVSATQIAFAYANNIWVVERAGGLARRLTSFQGQTSNPHFSPDGKWIAFSAEYAGNADVYVAPAEGGEPKRLTWRPGADTVQGWTPDGKAVLFTSGRATWAPNAAPRFWTVPAEGGVEEPLPLPRGYQGKISPDGLRIAYRMNNSWDEERRNYRGGQNRPIWIVDLKSYDLASPPWTDSKDVDPVWVGDAVYFISDRDGVSNVWAYDAKTKKLAQVTKFTDFDVKSIDSGAGAVVFEQAGYIHELDPRSGKSRVVNITAAGDFPWMMPRWEDVTNRMSNIALAHRQTRGGRSAWRNLHHSRRKGRRAESQQFQRLCGARPDLVAGRKVRFIFQRQIGRIQAGGRSAGWIDAAARDRAAKSDALLHSVVVARFEEDSLYRHEPESLGVGCRLGPGQDRRE